MINELDYLRGRFDDIDNRIEFLKNELEDAMILLEQAEEDLHEHSDEFEAEEYKEEILSSLDRLIDESAGIFHNLQLMKEE